MAFISALIDQLGIDYAIDSNRVFVTGFSNGSSMTFRIGAELADCVTIEGLGYHWACGKSQAPAFLGGKNTDKLNAADLI